MLKTLKRIWADCALERQVYPGWKGSVVRLYDRALARWRKAPLPFRGSVTGVRVKGITEPLKVRLGSTDWQVLNEIYKAREYDCILNGAIRTPDYIVDLGSNIGASVRLWRKLFPDAKIIAVEPDEANAEMFSLNLEKEILQGKVKLLKACVVGFRRSVTLDRTKGEWAYQIRECEREDQKIQTLTMDEVLANIPQPGKTIFLKCDIEGAEVEVLRTCKSWLSKIQDLLIELHGSYRTSDMLGEVDGACCAIKVTFEQRQSNRSLVLLKVN